MARRHRPIAQADWDEAEVSWSGLTPGQIEVARRVYDELLALEWLSWPARAEAKRRVLLEVASDDAG